MASKDDRLREAVTLQVYHDDELGYFARRRMQRLLLRSPDLRGQLSELVALSSLVRESAPAVTPPDVWAGIADGLANVDAERAAGAARGLRAGPFAWILQPAGAFVAVAAAAVVLALALVSRDTATGGVVHWIDAGDRNVMVLDGEDDVTVIWVFDPISEGASRGGRREAA
jgi:hypothetical protein